MSKPLVSASVAAPGFFGLNTQESSVTLEDGFALEATNCIIDKYGRLGARKGWIERATVDSTTLENTWTGDIKDLIKSGTVVRSSGTETVTLTFKSPHSYDLNSTVYFYSSSGNGEYLILRKETPFVQTLSFATALSNAEFTVTSSTTIVKTSSTTEADSSTTYTSATKAVVATYNNTPADPATFISDVTSTPLTSVHRFVDIAGTETIITNSEYGFYKGISGSLTQIITTTNNTTIPTNLHCATLNDKAYFFQEEFTPLVYNGSTEEITDVSDSNCPEANTVLSAYGRLWAARTTTDKMTVYWSDLLDGENWSTGSAGSIDLSAIMVQGTDEIVGLGAQNGRLIVFTRRSIVIFGDSTGGSTLDPATLVLVEVINRVGCVARDSIQNTGTDIIFLSEDGLRSLGRVIQEKSLPMRDLSANIRDELVQAVASEDVNNIKSVYSEDNAFYLLLLPRYERIYCFDTRAPLPNGALRVTIWNNQRHTNMLSLPNDIYFTNPDGLCEYFGYLDNTASYSMRYLTNYFDLGSPTQTKILKKLTLTVIGLSSQDFVLKTAFDYIDSYRSYVGTLQALPGSEYNEAEYGLNDTVLSASQTSSTITVGTGEHYTADFQLEQDETYDVPLNLWLDDDTYYYSNDDGTRTQTTVYTQQGSYTYEYSVGTVSEPIRLSVGGAGSVLQVGFETTVDGSEFSIQKMDVYAKQGRVY